MVIKVNFDLTMTVSAYNLYRLLAMNLPGYTHNTAETLYEKFLCNSGEVEITDAEIQVKMKKKRNLPALLGEMESSGISEYPGCKIKNWFSQVHRLRDLLSAF